ncbi:MAG: hypothetical protein IJ008_02715 [Clostridia bacterium]|nr:hypothetical protein [Clostridia bacterium]
MSIKIITDSLFICERLREIDKNYFIVFNEIRNKFEVHNSAQNLDTYCLTLPYDFLDERCIDLVLKTRIENKDKLIKLMDLENEKLEKKELKNILNGIREVVYDS